MTTKDIGNMGEEAAVNYLISQGYVILDRNWRCGHLELDIVALDGDFLAIVEVKTREVNSIVSPIEAMTKSKQKNLINAANGYVFRCKRHEEVRFDIVSVIHHNGQVVKVELIKYAFYPSLRTR
jgi:putative endonuclease